MGDSKESVWFKGSNEIQCTLKDVEESLSNIGTHYVGVVSLMPGISSTELVEEGVDHLSIKTNEGLMVRKNFVINVEEDKISVEFDEEYKAGKVITATSHFRDEFIANGPHVTHNTVISQLKAPGFVGFFYRNFGSGNIGKAFLNAYKTFLEKN